MTYTDSDLLQLSGLQHFMFCRRQWALIHIEQQWRENYRTVEGSLMHERAHDAGIRETRGELVTVRALPVRSYTLGVSGECDVVEFRRGAEGAVLAGREGLWCPFPVEYKHGSGKSLEADRLQLVGQALCLEEMLSCPVPEGALFYGETRRRVQVPITEELRQQVKSALSEMHDLYRRGVTPKVKPTKSCGACSLKELCLPNLVKRKSARAYLREAVEESL
ncbi:MAG: CRISPR-associated protein Cas4 [bacterium]